MTEIGIQRSSRRRATLGVSAIRKDGRIVGYQARTRLPSKQVLTKYFSVDSYGAASAPSLAISERRHQLAEISGGALAPRALQEGPRSRPGRNARPLKLTALDVDLEAKFAAILMAEHDADLVGIDRIEIVNAEGWTVLVRRGHRSLLYYFLDARYGGAEVSLSEAIRFRDAHPAHRKRLLRVSAPQAAMG